VTDSPRVTEVHSYPFSIPARLDMEPSYARLRREEPLARVQLPFGEPAWLVTRHADVRTVLSDPRFSRAASIGRDEPRTTPRPIQVGIMAMDPPDHTRLRKLVNKAFTVRRVEQLRARTEQIADDLLDGMVAAGSPADLIEHFARPLPDTVICELFGVPVADQHLFHTWSSAVEASDSLSEEQIKRIEQYLGNMYMYLAQLVAERRKNPTDDLLGAMVTARDEQHDQLTDEEMVQLASSLLAAGHETTVTQIGNFVYLLLTHPDRLRELREHPELIPNAVEEFMRYVPLAAVSGFARYATDDVELSGGLVRAGEPVIASLHSANRDGDVFADPDEISFHREANPHVGFSYGPHHCLGAHMARMELQVALGTVVRRFPNLRLGVAEEDLPWKSGLIARGVKKLPVVW
jgi:cytochrome P450